MAKSFTLECPVPKRGKSDMAEAGKNNARDPTRSWSGSKFCNAESPINPISFAGCIFFDLIAFVATGILAYSREGNATTALHWGSCWFSRSMARRVWLLGKA